MQRSHTMSEQRNVPVTVEQMSVNNMVNIEALLDCLIQSGVLTEAKFLAAKQSIENRILEAQKANATPGKSALPADGPVTKPGAARR
jgi:hypothetical protein